MFIDIATVHTCSIRSVNAFTVYHSLKTTIPLSLFSLSDNHPIMTAAHSLKFDVFVITSFCSPQISLTATNLENFNTYPGMTSTTWCLLSCFEINKGVIIWCNLRLYIKSKVILHALFVDQRGLEDLQLQLFPNFTFQVKTCINKQLQTFASYSVTACSFVAMYSEQHCNVIIHTVSTRYSTTQVLQQQSSQRPQSAIHH